MAVEQVQVRNADRMMTLAAAGNDGLHVSFADGHAGVIPFADIPEIGGLSKVESMELPNPYELLVTDSQGVKHEIPWDFARHYSDPSYRPRVEAVAQRGRQSLGERLREVRTAAGITQAQLAAAAGIGRVTLVRLERGEQSPRYETLVAIALALGRPVGELLVAN